MGLREVNGQIVETGPAPKVEFFTHSRKVGVGRWEPVPYIKIRARGVRDFATRMATDADKAMYPEEWALYARGESAESGTGLSILPAYTQAYGLELEVVGIESVEDLAALERVPTGTDGEPMVHLAKLLKQAKHYMTLQEADDGSEG